MKHYILLLIAAVISGCQPVIKLIYGIKDPDFYSSDYIMKFQKEIGLDSIPYYGFTPENWIALKGRSYPDLFVFDKDGKFINFHDTLNPNCNGPAELFLSRLDTLTEYNYSEKFTLSVFIDMFEDSECNKAKFPIPAGYDFYVFLSYASFAGKKVNRINTAAWRKAVLENKNVKSKLFYINEDLKSCWTDDQKKLFEEKE